MATTYFVTTPGTSLVFGDPDSASTTHNLSLNGLAPSVAVTSASIDFGAQWDEEWVLTAALKSASGTVPTAGLTCDFYLPTTPRTDYWPAGLTGASGTWPADGIEDEWTLQAGGYVGCLVATADASTMQVQGSMIFRPAARYGQLIIDNNLNVALWDTVAASSNVSRIFMTARRMAAS